MNSTKEQSRPTLYIDKKKISRESQMKVESWNLEGEKKNCLDIIV